MPNIATGASSDLFDNRADGDSGGRPPAKSLWRGCSPHLGLRVRCESVRAVLRSRALLRRPVPNPNRPIRNNTQTQYRCRVVEELLELTAFMKARGTEGVGAALLGSAPARLAVRT